MDKLSDSKVYLPCLQIHYQAIHNISVYKDDNCILDKWKVFDRLSKWMVKYKCLQTQFKDKINNILGCWHATSTGNLTQIFNILTVTGVNFKIKKLIHLLLDQ